MSTQKFFLAFSICFLVFALVMVVHAAEEKTFIWNLKPIYPGFEDIDIYIFGKNEDKKVWIMDICRFDIL